uniref:hypothetical protein n=1 Tax=Alloprevotella sp. TaxID=1872471 RepID=UPI004024D112
MIAAENPMACNEDADSIESMMSLYDDGLYGRMAAQYWKSRQVQTQNKDKTKYGVVWTNRQLHAASHLRASHPPSC